ncbi:MAG: hypothetical protein RMJ84_07685 [Sandaracinaceae bacterium]|nr:hypothetical protein [Sandaracinaceae bacterium]
MESSIPLSVCIEEAKSKGLRWPSESIAFLILECIESMGDSPKGIDANDLRIAFDGRVLFSAGKNTSAEEASRLALELMKHLLAQLGEGPVPKDFERVLQGEFKGEEALEQLKTAIESVLFPLNRDAARRTIARLAWGTSTAQAKAPTLKDFGNAQEIPTRSLWKWVLVALLMLLATAFGYWLAQSHKGAGTSPDEGRVSIDSMPPGAEVFLALGASPILVQGLSTESEEELLVWMDGFFPERVTIPKEAHQDAEVLELTVELRPIVEGHAFTFPSPRTDLKVNSIQLGDGKVRLLSDPPGAKVFRRLGKTPIKVHGISPKKALAFLFVQKGYHPEERVLSPSDWHLLEARLEVALKPIKNHPSDQPIPSP